MNHEFSVINIREYLDLGLEGENLLNQVLSTFSCEKTAM